MLNVGPAGRNPSSHPSLSKQYERWGTFYNDYLFFEFVSVVCELDKVASTKLLYQRQIPPSTYRHKMTLSRYRPLHRNQSGMHVIANY